jgi:predicted small integral membrane protein
MDVSAVAIDFWPLAAAAAVVVVAIVVLWVWAKNRPRTGGHVFRARRLSRGNRLFPAQVIITPTSITLYKPQWIGRLEQSIHPAHVASIKIDTNILFSDVVIETSGGEYPVVCHGHSKRDAVRMKELIEQIQTQQYRR